MRPPTYPDGTSSFGKLKFRLYRRYAANDRLIKALVSILLILAIIIAYLFLIALYLRPEILGSDVFIYPPSTQQRDANRYGTLTPAVVVAIVAVVIAGSTVTLVTRCVEESMWRSLAPKTTSRAGEALTVVETRHLAQWSVSTSARLVYLFVGGSNLLRLAGFCLLFCSLISPVLLAGISQEDRLISTTYEYISKMTFDDMQYKGWDGFHPQGRGYHIHDAEFVNKFISNQDPLGEVAFRSYLEGNTPPPAAVCNEDTYDQRALGETGARTRCFVNARAPGFQAKCDSKIKNHGDEEIPNVFSENKNFTLLKFKSHHSPELTATILNWPRRTNGTSVDFTGDRHFERKVENFVLTNKYPGNLATIFGAYDPLWPEREIVYGNQPYADDVIDYHIVDCVVMYGIVNVTQSGKSSPEILRDTFKVVSDSELEWPQYFFEAYGAGVGPWVFKGQRLNDEWSDEIFKFGLGTSLLGRTRVKIYLGDVVAERIEQAWDANNAFAFGRNSSAADITKTLETYRVKYVYNPKYLLCLIIPLFAIIAGGWNRWWINNGEVSLGYDPIKIARHGPVDGLEGKQTLEEEFFVVDELKVVGCVGGAGLEEGSRFAVVRNEGGTHGLSGQGSEGTQPASSTDEIEPVNATFLDKKTS